MTTAAFSTKSASPSINWSRIQAVMFPHWIMWAIPSFFLALCALIDVSSTRINVAPHGYMMILFWFGCAALLMVWRYARFHAFDWFLHRVWGAAIIFFWMIYTVNCVALFSHMLFAMAYPLIDARLIVADRTLGFDWNAYAHFMFDNYWPNQIFSFAYADLTMSVMMLTPAIALMRNDRIRLLEICFLMLATAITCVTISGLWPAYPTTAAVADAGILQAMSANGHHYLDRVVTMIDSLRTSSTVVIDPRTTEGLVTFPSFHCCMAMIIIRSNRGLGLLSLATTLIGLSIILATPVYGGHYLTDLLGGGTATLFFIWVWDTYFAKSVSPTMAGTKLGAYDLPQLFKRRTLTAN